MSVLADVCSKVQFLPDQYKTEMHNDNVTIGLVLVANKTRCGVKSADFPDIKDTCYCADKDKDGVKNGFWHIMEVLSLPWQEKMWWPNSTEFKEAKQLIETNLDKMYIDNNYIFGMGYVRSVVIKMLRGEYELQYQGPRNDTAELNDEYETPDNVTEENIQLEYVYDDIVDPEYRRFIQAKGHWQHAANVYSTQIWVEHQFFGDFDVNEMDADDFLFEHTTMLYERNGQWLADDNKTVEFWLSQGCYISGKCLAQGE